MDYLARIADKAITTEDQIIHAIEHANLSNTPVTIYCVLPGLANGPYILDYQIDGEEVIINAVLFLRNVNIDLNRWGVDADVSDHRQLFFSKEHAERYLVRCQDIKKRESRIVNILDEKLPDLDEYIRDAVVAVLVENNLVK